MITEAAYLFHPEDKAHKGKFALGTWNYTKTFDHITKTNSDANGDPVPVQVSSYGSYLLIDKNLTENQTIFLRAGIASREATTNKVSSSVSGGYTVKGLIPQRQNDLLGIAFASAQLNPQYLDQQSQAGTGAPNTETTYEINYRIELTPGLALQPDFQYVQHPASSETIKNASVVAIRIEIGL